MKEQSEKQDKKRQLHNINTRIYQIIDDLNEIDISLGLAFKNLRDATENIQKGISSLIDLESEKNKTE